MTELKIVWQMRVVIVMLVHLVHHLVVLAQVALVQVVLVHRLVLVHHLVLLRVALQVMCVLVVVPTLAYVRIVDQLVCVQLIPLQLVGSLRFVPLMFLMEHGKFHINQIVFGIMILMLIGVCLYGSMVLVFLMCRGQ